MGFEYASPVDTGRKLNVHKTFRRRPGHLLNVLYTFNLRSVSTGSETANVKRRIVILPGNKVKKINRFQRIVHFI